eukprot:NODE_428_length_1515_cov_92.247839_g396_i0.p1 GENE.NODE_428_length_1515_cov_92.247839_g396_i0~~NODE_428_length_1515_cov_92.247839_g396_i0.p1  ORF type:complete len:363 (-),score=29.11 NODE_428_length_1515_cov_92.247839_g396_i0:288-1376(-)
MSNASALQRQLLAKQMEDQGKPPPSNPMRTPMPPPKPRPKPTTAPPIPVGPSAAKIAEVAWPKWEDHWSDRKIVQVNDTDSFCTYWAGPSTGPLVVLLHGAGLSAMSWAPCVSHMKSSLRLMAIDFRSHGDSRVADPDNFGLQTLIEDVARVLQTLFPAKGSCPQLIVVGHSAGAAIACWFAKERAAQFPILGLVMVDVVEGTALESLKHMNTVLDRRPKSFASLTAAVQWYLAKGGMKSLASARITVPSQFDEQQPEGMDKPVWVWKTDLRATAAYWREWFEGLSDSFLGSSVPKLLLLAGMDRLDKTLTVAQMQGKFQLGLVYGAGHYMQEDNPTETAQRILEFASRLIKRASFISMPVR